MSAKQSLTCLILLLFSFSTSEASSHYASKNKTIHILSLLSNQADSNFNSDNKTLALALEMAAERINSQTKILPDYRIQLVNADSGNCSNTRSVQIYSSVVEKLFYSQYNVVGVIGPTCSITSVALSSLLSKGISLVTLHGGNEPVLADRSQHPLALGSLGSSEGFSRFAIKLIHKSNWTRIAVLFDEVDRSNTATISKLYNEVIIPSGEGYVSSVSKTHLPLADIVKRTIRVIFLFLPVSLTQRVLCMAQHKQMVYSYYQWIINGNTFDEIAQNVNFTYEGHNYTCSKEEMKSIALNGTYFIKFQLSAQNESATTISGYSFDQYMEMLQRRIEEYNSESTNINISYSPRTTYFYDSLWAWSVALDGLTKKHPNLDLGKYNYGNYTVTNMLLDEFYDLDFDGMSGRFTFNASTGYVDRALSLFQVVDKRSILVAVFADGVFKKVGPFISISDQFESQISTANDSLLPPLFLIGTLELSIMITLHLLTVVYRSRPSVKAATFWLNQFIYLGCYFALFAVLLFTLQEHSKFSGSSSILIRVTQNLSTIWLLPIGVLILFGSMIAQTWRLYRIFIHYLNPGPFISNKFLFLFLIGLISLNVIFCIFWTAFAQLQPENIFIRNTIHTQIYVRRWKTNQVWTFIYVAFIFILYLITATLSFLTRGIQNQSFSTKALRLGSYLGGPIVFGSLGISTLFESATFLLPDDIRVQIILSLNVGAIFVLILLITIFLHLPPLLPIFRKSLCKLREMMVKESTGTGSSLVNA